MTELRDVRIEPRFPSFSGGGAISPEFEAMEGAEIIAIGMPVDLDLEGGGFAIRYRKSNETKTLIVAFNELGMWIDD